VPSFSFQGFLRFLSRFRSFLFIVGSCTSKGCQDTFAISMFVGGAGFHKNQPIDQPMCGYYAYGG
jgi:hypothetical protein